MRDISVFLLGLAEVTLAPLIHFVLVVVWWAWRKFCGCLARFFRVSLTLGEPYAPRTARTHMGRPSSSDNGFFFCFRFIFSVCVLFFVFCFSGYVSFSFFVFLFLFFRFSFFYSLHFFFLCLFFVFFLSFVFCLFSIILKKCFGNFD